MGTPRILVLAGLLAWVARTGGAEPAHDKSLATPKDAMAQQVKLILAADVENLRLCFTEHVRAKITKTKVLLAQGELRHTKLDDIVTRIDEETRAGHKIARIISHKGVTVVTLVLVNDQWLADAVWFY